MFTGCKSSLYTDYILTKKYPSNIPNLDLKILNDTTGLFINREDRSIKQNFEFIKNEKNFLIITFVDESNNLVYLKEGDTIVYYRKELYLMNKKHKLIFNRKQ